MGGLTPHEGESWGAPRPTRVLTACDARRRPNLYRRHPNPYGVGHGSVSRMHIGTDKINTIVIINIHSLRKSCLECI